MFFFFFTPDLILSWCVCLKALPICLSVEIILFPHVEYSLLIYSTNAFRKNAVPLSNGSSPTWCCLFNFPCLETARAKATSCQGKHLPAWKDQHSRISYQFISANPFLTRGTNYASALYIFFGLVGGAFSICVPEFPDSEHPSKDNEMWQFVTRAEQFVIGKWMSLADKMA